MANDDDRLFRASLLHAAAELGLTLTAGQVDAMTRHWIAVREINRSMNLTRITAALPAAVRHYADSLAAPAWCAAHNVSPLAVLDLGTGGGYPAVPVAIACPGWQVTAIDSTTKKINWLAAHLARHGPANCRALVQRAEQWPAPAPRFDLILCRAVGPAAGCLRSAARLCAPGGVVACYKTAAAPADERHEAGHTARRLGFTPLAPWPYALTEGSERLHRELWCYRADHVPSP